MKSPKLLIEKLLETHEFSDDEEIKVVRSLESDPAALGLVARTLVRQRRGLRKDLTNSQAQLARVEAASASACEARASASATRASALSRPSSARARAASASATALTAAAVAMLASSAFASEASRASSADPCAKYPIAS